MVRQAIRATTAAPTFFAPVMINGALYSDGALLCNNPSAVAVHEAKVFRVLRTFCSFFVFVFLVAVFVLCTIILSITLYVPRFIFVLRACVSFAAHR